MRAPSIKRLMAFFPNVAPIELNAVKRAIQFAADATTVDAALEVANKALEGFGVEAVNEDPNGRRRTPRGNVMYYGSIGLLYVNTGDSYNATILYDTRRETFILSTLGDVVERAPRRFA